MKADFYKYCILQYKHSPLLEETINMGVLIYFSNSSTFKFTYSKNLSRVKSIYDNVPEKTIREYLRQISKRFTELNIHKDIFYSIDIDDFDSFLNKYILPIDSTVLQFSKCKENLQRHFDNEFIAQTIVSKHFVEDIKHSFNVPKEPELLQKFYNEIRTLDLIKVNSKSKKFYVDYTLKNETGNEFKFDYAWQNGTLNLVKPISFDLKEAKSIAEKAYKNLGQFIDLENEAEKKGLRYDLLIGRPTSKSLFKEYDHAISLLEKIKHAKIVEEKDIKQYSVKAIRAITD